MICFQKNYHIYILQAHQINSILKNDSLDFDLLWTKPIGTGPYSFSSYIKEQNVSLQRFEAYHDSKSNIKRYNFYVATDEYAKKRFLSGNFNVITDVSIVGDDYSEYYNINASINKSKVQKQQVLILNNN